MDTQNLEWLGDDTRHAVAEQYHIGSVFGLSDDDLMHLALVCDAVLRDADYPELHRWMQSVLSYEHARRRSDGAIERGLVPLPLVNYTNRQLKNAIFRLDCIRDMQSLSDSERAFIGELHRKVLLAVCSRMLDADDSVKLLDVRDVCELTNCSRGQVLKMIRDGRLPRPLALGPRLKRWTARSVRNALRAMQE
jgi:predicted DNA-binding transcriptional regulator AlpA